MKENLLHLTSSASKLICSIPAQPRLSEPQGIELSGPSSSGWQDRIYQTMPSVGLCRHFGRDRPYFDQLMWPMTPAMTLTKATTKCSIAGRPSSTPKHASVELQNAQFCPIPALNPLLFLAKSSLALPQRWGSSWEVTDCPT